MISNANELSNCVDVILRPKGYVKKKETWYKFTSECICFFVLKKSPFSGQFENLLGCVLKEINEDSKEFPEYFKNHLSFELEHLAGKELVENAFSLEYRGFSGDRREEIIRYLIEDYVVPFLSEIGSKEGIKQAFSKYSSLKYRMRVNLKNALALPVED